MNATVMRIRFRHLAAAGAVVAMVGAPAAAMADDAFPVAYSGPYPVPYDEGSR